MKRKMLAPPWLKDLLRGNKFLVYLSDQSEQRRFFQFKSVKEFYVICLLLLRQQFDDEEYSLPDDKPIPYVFPETYENTNDSHLQRQLLSLKEGHEKRIKDWAKAVALKNAVEAVLKNNDGLTAYRFLSKDLSFLEMERPNKSRD